jgi:1-acyl-sn-glycerol-3-phosphate acyltransferase
VKGTRTLWRLYLTLVLRGMAALPGLLYLRWTRSPRAEGYLLDRAARWGRASVTAAGARVRVEGAERIPTEGPVVYVANHQGALDIPIMMGFLPGVPAFVAKRELFRIPILGFWMRTLGCVGLDRDNPRAARDQLREAAEHVRDGRRVVIFPEGTRSRDPEGRMGPFKRGSLKLAAEAGATVVPVTLEGSRFLLADRRPNDFEGEVRLIVGEPVAVPSLDAPALRALPDRLFSAIDAERRSHAYGRSDVEEAAAQ